jgi:serine/threonine-protein kinase
MSSEVHEGQILAGKFRIERVLGQGGMGVVVAATHLQLDERVALKFLLPDALGNPEAVERFAREARAAVKIKSEHVARVSDVGTLESGSPYMVMEYLEGQDLGAWVRSYGAMKIPEAIEFLLQACEALAEAHLLGIVHRDLKPANLFVTRRADGSPCIKVLDFGISKLTLPGTAPELGMTKTNTVMGSPLYMSPEQMSSTRNVDRRTDIWALGVIFYEILTGRVPFEAETMPQLCGMILQDPPRPLRDLRPDVPDTLQWVVWRCLEKDRERRFNNVAELALSLAPFGTPVAQRSADRISRVLGVVSVPTVPELAVTASSTRSVTASNWGGSKEPKKSRATWFVALATLTLLAAAVAFFVVRSHTVAEPMAEPSSKAAAVLEAHAVAPPAPEPPALQTPPASAAPFAAPMASPSARAPAQAPPLKGSPLKAKPKPSPAQPVAPAIDPLDGRR